MVHRGVDKEGSSGIMCVSDSISMKLYYFESFCGFRKNHDCGNLIVSTSQLKKKLGVK